MICDGACDDDEALLRAGAIAFCIRLERETEEREEEKMCQLLVLSSDLSITFIICVMQFLLQIIILKLVSWALTFTVIC